MTLLQGETRLVNKSDLALQNAEYQSGAVKEAATTTDLLSEDEVSEDGGV